MTVDVIIKGLDKVKLVLRGLDDDLTVTKPAIRRLFRAIGRAGRDAVRSQITTQGGGNWAKLSKWTRARTARRKALITERERITFRLKPSGVEVVYPERSNEWNLTKHHKGFTRKGVKGKIMTVPLRNPAAIRWNKPSISFLSSKDSVIPARNVWGTQKQHVDIAQTETLLWMRGIIKKGARK